MVKLYYTFIEETIKEPKNVSEFGYFGTHYILSIPDEIKSKFSRDELPLFFELQIKTIFQHAWGEAEHDLNYKSVEELAGDEKRLVAFSAAQAWGADQIFNQLVTSQKERNA